MGDDEDGSQKWWPYVGIPGAIVATATIIGALLGVFDTDTATNRGVPTADESVPTSASVNTTTTPTITSTTAGRATTAAPRPSLTYLSDDEYVDEGGDACGSPESGPFHVARKAYNQSVAVFISCRMEGGPTWVDYNVPPGCESLQATAGIDDNAGTGARLTFEVLDAHTGTPLVEPKTLGINETLPVDVPIRGVGRVRLQTTWIPQSGVRTFAGVFGNARFVCK